MRLKNLLADKPKRSLAFEAFALAALAAMAARLLAGPGWGSAALLGAAAVGAAFLVSGRRTAAVLIMFGMACGWLRADFAPPPQAARYRPAKTSAGPLAGLRAGLLEEIDSVFRAPVSAWVAGLLIGEDSGFSQEWKNVFKRTGTSHLTAVSGFNVFVVLRAGEIAFRRLHPGRKTAFALSAALLAFFVLLTGAPASVLRAAVMAWSNRLSGLLGRPVKPLRSLILALLVLCFWNPSMMTGDRGFQLSALATFGLVTMSEPLSKTLFRRWPEPLREWAGQAAAATAATAPLIAWWTGSYSLVTFAANIAVTVFIPLLMGGGAALTALGFLWPGAAQALAGVTESFFALPLLILKDLAALPPALLRGWPAFAALAATVGAAFLLSLAWWRRADERNFLSHEEETLG